MMRGRAANGLERTVPEAARWRVLGFAPDTNLGG
jgi:hypothetical protein